MKLIRILRYCICAILLFAVAGSSCLYAKEGRLKLSKHIKYEGRLSDAKGGQIPSGFGILSIYHPTDQKEPELTITGVFDGWQANDAHIVWANGVIFKGSLKIEVVNQKNIKTEFISIVLLPGGTFSFPKVAYPAKSDLSAVSSSEATARITIGEKPQMFKVEMPDSIHVNVPRCDYTLGVATVSADMAGVIVFENNGSYRLNGGPVSGTIRTQDGVFTGSFGVDEYSWKEGSFISNDGMSYSGTFSNGSHFDQGTLHWTSGDWAKGTISGDYRTIANAELVSGTCLLHLESGTYEGSIREGLFEEGKFTELNGDVRSGRWAKKEGQLKLVDGTINAVSRDTLIGTIKDGRLWEGYLHIREDSSSYVRGTLSQGRIIDGYRKGRQRQADGSEILLDVMVRGDVYIGEIVQEQGYRYPYRFYGTKVNGKIEGSANLSYGPYNVVGIWKGDVCQQATVQTSDSKDGDAFICRTDDGSYRIQVRKNGKSLADMQQESVSFPETLDYLGTFFGGILGKQTEPETKETDADAPVTQPVLHSGNQVSTPTESISIDAASRMVTPVQRTNMNDYFPL